MKLSHFLYFLVPLASARAVPYHHQIPITEESATEDLTSAKKIDLDATPSIGVHFTTTQAVVAARYPNGTTIDVVQIPGDAGYTDLMSRWMFRYSDYEILRNRNDSVVLAAFISRVHTTIEAQLKIPQTDHASCRLPTWQGPANAIPKRFITYGLHIVQILQGRLRHIPGIIRYSRSSGTRLVYSSNAARTTPKRSRHRFRRQLFQREHASNVLR